MKDCLYCTHNSAIGIIKQREETRDCAVQKGSSVWLLIGAACEDRHRWALQMRREKKWEHFAAFSSPA